MRQPKFSDFGRIGFAMSYVLTMLVSAFFGYMIGQWLDKKTGFAPFFMIICLLAGIFLGFYSIIKEILLMNEREKKRKGK